MEMHRLCVRLREQAPQVICRVGILDLTGEAALAVDLLDTTQPKGGSEFIREGAGTFDGDASPVRPSSRMNSLPQVICCVRILDLAARVAGLSVGDH